MFFTFYETERMIDVNKKYILKENEDFNRIISTIKPNIYKDYIIYIEKINDDSYHFGFSVGKKIGNAVTRNKIKRQLKNIINKKNYQNNFNCIIMVKKRILNKSFKEMEEELNYILEKLQLSKGESI